MCRMRETHVSDRKGHSASCRRRQRKEDKMRQRRNGKEKKRQRDKETLGSTKRMEAAGKHDGVVEKGVEFRAHDGA